MRKDNTQLTNLIYGAFVGDAIGAHVEFSSANVAEERVNTAMAMVGGGTHQTAPGQITDDSEMAIGLLRSILTCEGYYEGEALEEYRDWAKSGPFDMGGTTRTALLMSTDLKPVDHIKRVAIANRNSQANGALMRITPMIAYCYNKNIRNEEAYTLACSDTKLTHPNLNCLVASVFYMEVAFQLLDGVEAHAAIVNTCTIVKEWSALFGRELSTAGRGLSEMLLSCANKDTALPACDQWDCGWWGVALKCSIWALINAKSYDHGIRAIITMGGDTDTNACIAGGLLGVIHAPSQQHIDAIDNCSTASGRLRPSAWTTRNSLRVMVKRLLNQG